MQHMDRLSKALAELKKRHSGKDRNLRKEIRKVVAKGWG